jgi:hypothetical protein
MGRSTTVLVVTFSISLVMVVSLILHQRYSELGLSPEKILDYAEKRLEDHAGLSALFLPVLTKIRDWVNEPAAYTKYGQAFIIPPPPNLLAEPSEKGLMAGVTHDRHIIHVGPSEAIKRIDEAAILARDGDVIEIDSGEYHGDVTVWPQKSLTIRGVGGNARLFAEGKIAEGKGIWVLRSGHFDIENIEFIGARSQDRNGAGIRFEKGSLHIRNCLFYGNENGLLTANDHDSELEIENSEFAYNGAGDGQSHNLYVGEIHSLKVTGSYFHHANVGHLVKSRAEFNLIAYNRITDENGGKASYELDFPSGGISTVIGNIIQQGPDTENSTVISYGEEGYIWPSNFYLASNTVVNDRAQGGTFLKVTPGAEAIISTNNIFVGAGEYLVPKTWVSFNDIHAEWDIFELAQRQNYHLNTKGQLLAFKAPPENMLQRIDLTPQAEYAYPRLVRVLTSPPRFPGAVQTIEH